MPRGRKKQDPFANIPGEFKEAISSMEEAEIRDRISQIVMGDIELKQTQKLDEDLGNLKEQVRYAMEPYREGYKMNRLKMEFCRRVLEDRGVVDQVTLQTANA